MPLIIPENYESDLDIVHTQAAIKHIKDFFEKNLAQGLNLRRVSAPLFVKRSTGVNDDLNGQVQSVFFVHDQETIEVVHSLAKWKRQALANYEFETGTGLYTDMNAIRAMEEVDNIHSYYVDQWDWEKVIREDQLELNYLQSIVTIIYEILLRTENYVNYKYKLNHHLLSPTIHFVDTQELLDKYPELTSKQREKEIVKELGSVFLMRIGHKLSNGEPHDQRAADYDDWNLNGDILVYNPILDDALELSSMGIRVNSEVLIQQMRLANRQKDLQLEFHQQLLDNQLPLTIGGGIGQSRLCMFFLQKAHIGEVQASVWPKEMEEECKRKKIHLL